MAVKSETAQAETLRDRRLRRLLLEQSEDPAFDRLARLAAAILDTPVALVTILDVNRQFFKSCMGLPEPWQTWQETPLSHSFCRLAVETDAPLVIEDAREHPLVRDNPAIQDLNVIAYLGIPLSLRNSSVLGAFCVIDSRPRKWTQEDIEIMQGLTACVVTEIELRLAVIEAQEQATTARREHSEKEDVQRAREDAEATLAQLDTIYQSAPIGLALIDPEQRFARINAAAAEATGRALEDLLHQRVADAAPALWAQIECALEEACKDPNCFSLEITTDTGTGESPKFWLASLCVVRSRGGGTQGVSLTLVDVTEQKNATNRLRDSEQRYRSLFELNPNAVFAFAPDGRFLAANPTCKRVSGYSPAELRERTWMEIIAPERLDEDLESFVHALAGEPQFVETAIIHREGHRVDLRVTTVPMCVGDQIVGVFGIAEDVTEFRRAQAQLQQQAHLLDLTLDPIFAWELNGPIVFWNRGAERLYGYPREVALNQSPQQLLQSKNPDGSPFSPNQVREAGEWQGELWQLTQDGQEVIVDSQQRLLCEAQGRSLVLESNRDVTARRRAEESLRRQNQTLVDLAKSPVLTGGNLDQALELITTLAARTLGVRRVGVWYFDNARTQLRCRTLYDADKDRHTAGLTISVHSFPRYMLALEANRVIAAHDAALDPRTNELAEAYLRPLRIGAMLDAPIHKGGRLVGAICLEHIGGPRQWSPEEQNFAAGIADLVSMATEHVERRQAEQALDEAREQLLRSEVEKKQFTRDILRAVTHGKLHLVDPIELPEEGQWLYQLELNEPSNYRLFREYLQEIAESHGMPEPRVRDLVLAAGEVITNAIKHGVGGVASMLASDGQIVVRVSDRGPGIRTEDLPATVLETGYSTKISLGMGFTLLLQLVDEIWLATGPTGTMLQFQKKLVEEELDDPLEALLARFSDDLDTVP